MRVDLSVNIPTIISIVLCVAGAFSFALGIYRDLDNRQLRTDIAVVDIRTRLDKTEAALNASKGEQLIQTQALRSEVRGDINEIKDMLNRLIFNGVPQPQRRQLDKDWSK